MFGFQLCFKYKVMLYFLLGVFKKPFCVFMIQIQAYIFSTNSSMLFKVTVVLMIPKVWWALIFDLIRFEEEQIKRRFVQFEMILCVPYHLWFLFIILFVVVDCGVLRIKTLGSFVL
eukprot:TRINITY_DN1790_c0_g1_i11.p4 TRINITY_DN1790_c0_g1~~TRINITY_DN1790_c0_g1_i11.p4  ORF type:complete len:116 (-),score=0.56 TRINITY_DN1790_c0_g1_i11:268-615(-)